MKKILYLITIPLTLALFAGCSDDDNDFDNNELGIEYADYEFAAVGGQGKIVVQSTGNSVRALPSENWIEITTISGNEISFKVDDYFEVEGRSAKINLSSGDLRGFVTITQAGAIFKVSETYLYFTSGVSTETDNTHTLTVYTDNMDYDVSYTNRDWLNVQQSETDDNVYTVTVSNNSSIVNRLDTIRFTYRRLGVIRELAVPVAQLGTNTFSSYNNSSWTLSSVDGLGNPRPNVTVTFTVDETSSTERYLVTGLEFPLYINYYDGFFKIIAGVKVDDSDDDVDVYQILYEEASRYRTWSGAGLYGVLEIQPKNDPSDRDVLEVNFVDDGAWRQYVGTGFLFDNFTKRGVYLGTLSSTSQSTVYNHVKLVRQ